MTATITDKIMVASSGTRPNPTTLTAQKSVGASLLSADDLTGWGTSTPVTFVLYKIDTDGNEVIGSRTDWKGIVSGNTITQLTLTAGTDTIYPAGSPVIAAATARWADDFAAAMTVSHNQNGTLKDSTVTNTIIADGAVSTSKVQDAAVTFPKLGGSSFYKFRARRLTGQSITTAYTLIQFNTTDYNVGSAFDTTTNIGRFTVPAGGDGTYSISATVGCGTVGRITIALYKNGTAYSFGNDIFVASGSGSATARGVLSDDIQLVAGDYIDIRAAADVSRTISTTETQFSGRLLP